MKIKAIILILICVINLYGNKTLKVGVLAYGTVNWELDVLKNNNLDKKNGFNLEVVKLASKNAVAIALQSNTVDLIVTDWIWVNRQRAEGKDFTFFPYSKSIGALYINNPAIKDVMDLEGKRVGISGGSVDKTWLLFQAYMKYKYEKELKELITPVFAAPPILYKKMLDKTLEASINFWHYNAKLKAKGLTRLIGIEEILAEFDIKEDIPLVGWTFSNKFALENGTLIDGFLQASYESKKILFSSDKEWNRIKPLMKVKSQKDFESLKNGYKEGVVKEFTLKQKEASSKVFDILYKQGGKKLVGKSTSLDMKTFWDFKPNISW